MRGSESELLEETLVLCLGSIAIEIYPRVDAGDVREADSLEFLLRAVRIDDEPVGEEERLEFLGGIEVIAERRNGLEGLAASGLCQELDHPGIQLRRSEEIVGDIESVLGAHEAAEKLEFAPEAEVSGREYRFLFCRGREAGERFFSGEEGKVMFAHFAAEEIGEVLGSFIPGRYERTSGEKDGFSWH